MSEALEQKPDLPTDTPTGSTRRAATLSGWMIALKLPGAILFFTSIGFGALARDLGFSFGQAVFITGTVFALPAQVVLIDELSRGGAWITIVFAVTLTAVRLLPMTIVLTPLLKSPETPRWMLVAAVHFIAITTWLEGLRRLPTIEARLRVWYFYGLGLGMLTCTVSGTAAGFLIAGTVPAPIAAVLLFMTPLFFLLSLMGNASGRDDWMAIAIGGICGPALHWFTPDFDLLLAGVLGGTTVWLLGRRRG